MYKRQTYDYKPEPNSRSNAIKRRMLSSTSEGCLLYTSDCPCRVPHRLVGDDLLPADIARYADDIRPVAMGVLSAAAMGRFLGKMADTLPDGTFLRGHALRCA